MLKPESPRQEWRVSPALKMQPPVPSWSLKFLNSVPKSHVVVPRWRFQPLASLLSQKSLVLTLPCPFSLESHQTHLN